MEFELENDVGYYGTYTDDIVVQSGSTTTIAGRYYAGSKISGSFAWQFADKYSVFQREIVFPNRQIGSNRFLRLSSDKERFYDSMVPDFVKITQENNGKFVTSSLDAGVVVGTEPYLPDNIYKIYVSYGGTGITSSDASQVDDRTWYWAFPFENRYSDIQRIVNYSSLRVNCQVEEYGVASGPLTLNCYRPITITNKNSNSFVYVACSGSNSLVGRFVTLSLYDKSGSVTDYSTPTFTSEYTLAPAQREFNMAYFGFGQKAALVVPLIIPAVIAVPYYYYLFGGYIDGWKYGLYSGLPSYSTAVYRAKKYGQFRDRLEQRLYTKFFDGKFIKEGAVTITFVSGTDDYVSASGDPATYNSNDSGIYTFEYTSGKPFFDV